MAILLDRRAVVQVAVESVYGTAVSVVAADSVLVSGPNYMADPSILERNYSRDSLSQTPNMTGRMQAKMEFTTELRGNGKAQNTINNAPLIARLFRGCAFALSYSAAAALQPVYQVGDQINPVVWTSGGVPAVSDVTMYIITVTTPGASGVAKVTITSPTVGEGTAAAFITTAVAKTLGTSGATITPVFTGNLVNGQTWVVWVLPSGNMLKPVSTGMESLTLVMNRDGVQHTMPGSYGTFELTAEAGQIASIKWTFTGIWVPAVDAAMPATSFENTLPPIVELSRLNIDQFSAIVSKFSFSPGNDVQIRPDVNSVQGYIGTRIVSRKPTGGIDPEADLVANYDFWGNLRSADRMPFVMRVGQANNNTCWIWAPVTQYTGMTYASRSGILTYDAGLAFSAYAGDDEIFFFFT